MTSAATDLLETRDVRVSFGGFKAVDGVSLNIKEGSITGLIGPNGAGKSTLFNAIVGELNRGWDVAKYLLTHEREMISGGGGGFHDQTVIDKNIADPAVDAAGGVVNPGVANVANHALSKSSVSISCSTCAAAGKPLSRSRRNGSETTASPRYKCPA